MSKRKLQYRFRWARERILRAQRSAISVGDDAKADRLNKSLKILNEYWLMVLK